MKKVLLIIFAVFAFALEIPIQEHYKIKIPIGNITILEFPFKIKGIKSTTFMPLFKNKTSDILPPPPELKGNYLPPPNKKNKKAQVQSVSPTKAPVVITKGANIITLYPHKFGKFTLIVWGYKYPIMLDIEVVNNANIRYFKFVDYSTKKESAKAFEAVPHEKVIKKLMAYLFNRKTPKGYDSIVGNKRYKLNGFEFVLVRKIVGDRYEGSEWVLKNLTKDTVKLYEQMFYRNGIYAIAIENPILKPGESTRLFIVSKKGAI